MAFNSLWLSFILGRGHSSSLNLLVSIMLLARVSWLAKWNPSDLQQVFTKCKLAALQIPTAVHGTWGEVQGCSLKGTEKQNCERTGEKYKEQGKTMLLEAVEEGLNVWITHVLEGEEQVLGWLKAVTSSLENERKWLGLLGHINKLVRLRTCCWPTK